MHCPVCSTTQLVMSERQGIEIDYCPQCRGVWLDRGELDKIIERSAPVQTPAATPSAEGFGHQPQREQRPPQSQSQGYYKDKDDYRHRRKKGFLGELFDFD
ncbi:MAG TPA: zf-TFIIB domain-containing protein [Noviherbaspirillum sp.]|nr:zf-TFIIB domain-containing protein [Noviherbaspirillum sp.]